MTELIHFGSPVASVPVHNIPLPRLEKNKKAKKNKKRNKESAEAAIKAAQHDPVAHPSHYNRSKVEVIDLIRDESFLRGNVIKYVMRAPFKGNELEDIEKALVYLNWERDRLLAEGNKV